MQELWCHLLKELGEQQKKKMFHLLLANLKICTAISEYVNVTEEEITLLTSFLITVDENAKEKSFRDYLNKQYVDIFNRNFKDKSLAQKYYFYIRQKMPPTNIANVSYPMFAEKFNDFLMDNKDKRYEKLKVERAIRLTRLHEAQDRNQYSVFCEIVVPYLKALRSENVKSIQNLPLANIFSFIESLLCSIFDGNLGHEDLWHYILPLMQILDLDHDDSYPLFSSYESPSNLKNWQGGHGEGVLLIQHIAKKILDAENPEARVEWIKNLIQTNQYLCNNFSKTINHPLLKDNKLKLKEMRKVFYQNDKDIVVAQQEFSASSIELINTFLTEMAFLLGPAPCDFAFCILGSTSRGDRRPYSDVELLFLYNPHKNVLEEKLYTYIYQLICGVELAIKCLGETHVENSPLVQNAGFHIDSSNHLLTKQLFDTPEKVAVKFIIEIAKSADKDFHPWIEDENFYSFLRPKVINKSTFGSETVMNEYENKIKQFLADFLIGNDNPEALKSALKLSNFKDMENLTRSQIIALSCLSDVLKKSKAVLDALKPGDTVDIKNAFYKPLTYLALNLKLYYGLTANHPVDIFSEINQMKGFDKIPIQRLLQTAYRYVAKIQVRLHIEAGYQEEEFIWLEKKEEFSKTTILTNEEYAGLELLIKGIILPLHDLCLESLKNPQKEMKQMFPRVWDAYIAYRQEWYDKWINKFGCDNEKLFNHVLIELSNKFNSLNGWCPYYEEEIFNVLNKDMIILADCSMWKTPINIFNHFHNNNDSLIKHAPLNSTLRKKFLGWLLKRIAEMKHRHNDLYLHRVFLLIQKAVENHIDQVLQYQSLPFEFDNIIRDYFTHSLQECKVEEEYKHWFLDVTAYLLFTKELLETHRYYYRQLPEMYRQHCLISAKGCFDIQRGTQHWRAEKDFWTKLWDAPLSNGERSSHQEKKTQWKAKLTTLLSSDDEVKESKDIRIYIDGLKAGKFGLKPKIAKALVDNKWINTNGQFVQKKDHPVASRMPGNHLVIPWPLPENKNIHVILSAQKNKAEEEITEDLLREIQSKAKFYFKIYPEYPLVDLFLNELTYRLGHYSPREVDVWLWKSERYDYPILVSEAVSGKTLQEVFIKNESLKLNTQAFSESVMISGLTSLEDNKPDNIILLQKAEILRLCLIDADRWFAPAFKGNQLHAKNAVFCLKEMSNEVDAVFREEFLSLNPQQVLQGWVDEMEEIGNRCIGIFQEKIKSYFERRNDTRRTLLLPPLPFHAVNELFNHLQNSQVILLDSSGTKIKTTNSQLLSKINSRLANHYSLAREKHKKPLDCFNYVAGHAYLRGKGIQQEYFSSQINFKTGMQDMWGKEEEQKRAKAGIENNWLDDIQIAKGQLMRFNEKEEITKNAEAEFLQGQFLKFLQLGSNGKDKILNDFDWSKLSLAKQRELLGHLLNAGHWLNISIRNSQEIKDNDIMLLIQKSPLLKKLQLSNCENLTYVFFAGLPAYDSTIRIIILENLKNLRYIGYLGGRSYGVYFYEKCIELPNLEKLSITNCPLLESIHINSIQLKKIHLDGLSKLNVLRTQTQHLENLYVIGNTTLPSLKEFQKIMDSNYTQILSVFEWEAKSSLEASAARLFSRFPVLLGVNWGGHEINRIEKFINELNKTLKGKRIDYLKTSLSLRRKLLINVESLLNSFGLAIQPNAISPSIKNLGNSINHSNNPNATLIPEFKIFCKGTNHAGYETGDWTATLRDGKFSKVSGYGTNFFRKSYKNSMFGIWCDNTCVERYDPILKMQSIKSNVAVLFFNACNDYNYEYDRIKILAGIFREATPKIFLTLVGLTFNEIEKLITDKQIKNLAYEINAINFFYSCASTQENMEIILNFIMCAAIINKLKNYTLEVNPDLLNLNKHYKIISELIKVLRNSSLSVSIEAATKLENLAEGSNRDIENLFKSFEKKDKLIIYAPKNNNWGSFQNREIARYTFKFFDSKTLKNVGCVSKGCNNLQHEIEEENLLKNHEF